jgi:hypothetical protein
MEDSDVFPFKDLRAVAEIRIDVEKDVRLSRRTSQASVSGPEVDALDADLTRALAP